MPSTITIENLFVISEEVVKVEFTGDLAVDRYYLDTGTYQIIPSAGVTIEGVIRPIGRSSAFVVLLVRGAKAGTEYALVLPTGTLRSTSGSPLGDLSVSWIHRKTKVDIAVGSLSRTYDTNPFGRSNLRGLIEAVMGSDEEIGGDF